MSIYKNIKDAVSKMTIFNRSTYVNTGTTIQGEDYLDSATQLNYQDSLYISRGLEIIQDAVSAIDFKLFEIRNSKGEVEEIKVHEILDLLYKPNPYQTKSEFWRLLVLSMKLSGEAFIRILRDESSRKINGLIMLYANDIEVEMKPSGEIIYKYTTTEGNTLVLTTADVFHIKNPNMNTQLRGVSIMRTLISRVQAEIKATEYQSNLFGRNGNPDGIINVKNGGDEETLKQVKIAFYNSFRGKNESNRVAVVGGDATYTPLNSQANTLDFVSSKNNVRDEVFMALGVPKALITSDDVNRANADAALQQFMQFTIAPMFLTILEVFNERFIIPNYGEKYYLETEKLVTEDKDALLREAQVGVNKWLTVNEVRARFGYEPIDGGDVLKEPQAFGNLFGTNSIKVASKAILNKRGEFLTALKHKENFLKFRKVKAFQKMTSDPVFKLKFAKAVESVRQKGESQIKKEAKAFFKEELERILNKLDKVGDNVTTASDLFNAQEEKKNVKNFILPLYTTIATQAGNTALEPIKLLTSKGNNFVMNSALYKLLEKRADLFSESVTDTTYNMVSRIVAENMDKGVGEISKALRDVFTDMSTTRATTIARTESGYMTSLGSDMAYKESEVVSGKQWLTTGDDVVRPSHAMVDGQIVAKDEVFANGEEFPAQHSINCRCAIAPIVDINNL